MRICGRKLLLAMVRITVVYSIVSISIIALSFRFVVPFFKENLPHFWASLLGGCFIILCISPFLRAIMVKKKPFGGIYDLCGMITVPIVHHWCLLLSYVL